MLATRHTRYQWPYTEMQLPVDVKAPGHALKWILPLPLFSHATGVLLQPPFVPHYLDEGSPHFQDAFWMDGSICAGKSSVFEGVCRWMECDPGRANGVKEIEISVGRYLLFAAVEGKGPPLLFLHGQLGVNTVVRPLVSPLADGWQIVMPDVRGRGRSRCPEPEEHSWERYADDVVTVLNELDLGRAVIGGVSLGAGVALKTALRHPERVRALVLHSSVYAGEETGWLEEQKAVQSQVLEMAEAVMNDAREASGIVASPKWARSDPKSLAAAMIGLGYSQPFERKEDLSSVGVPVMIVPGTDNLHPRQVSEMYTDAMPEAVWIEPEPSEFPNALRDFLNSRIADTR